MTRMESMDSPYVRHEKECVKIGAESMVIQGKNGQQFGKEILGVLGIDPNNVASFTIDVQASGLPMIVIHRYIVGEEDKIVSAFSGVTV